MDHLETFLQVYDSRFAHSHGPLKPWVEKVFNQVLLCGDPNYGVTKFSCENCGRQMAVPFSCKTRICPSCLKRRAEEVSADLVERLPPVGHRHIVITIPKLAGLRLRVLEDPTLFRKIARLITRVLRRQLIRQLPLHRNLKKELLKTAKPGILLAQHSFSSDLSFQPHWHAVVSDGVFESDGEFNTLWHWDAGAILEDLRASILRAFVRWSRLSSEVASTLSELAAERSGFSCFVGPVIPAEDKQGLERLIRYLFRSPVSYRQLVYDEKTGKVKCRSKRGGYREWPHAVDFLATLAQHVPRPRQHVVTYAGHYANATGNLKPAPEEENEEPGEARPGATPTTKGKKWSWAKLIARVWQVDPLICDCGAQMKRGRKLKTRSFDSFCSPSTSSAIRPARHQRHFLTWRAPVTLPVTTSSSQLS